MRVYISADYDKNSGDREVVDVLNAWGVDKKHVVDFVDTAKVNSGSVSDDPDCRSCDLKMEFNRQINASSFVIFVIGDKTKNRTAGCGCERYWKNNWYECKCTPYKQNVLGKKNCKVQVTVSSEDDVGSINPYSYIQHEFEEAKKRRKKILIFYNALNKQPSWLPDYMNGYESIAVPFWIKNFQGEKVGNYEYIKKAFGYD